MKKGNNKPSKKRIVFGVLLVVIILFLIVACTSGKEEEKMGKIEQVTVVSYKNCTEVKQAGKAPIHKGEEGYSTKLDRDGDGIGCDK